MNVARLGRVLTTMGAVAIALTVVAAIVAFALVGNLRDSVDESLAVTVEALDTIDGTVSLSKQVVDSVAASLDAVGDTISTVKDSTGDVNATLTTLHEFVGSTLPAAIDGIQNALPTIKTVAGTIDSALEGVSRIPFGPDYQPEIPFADTIQQLIDRLAPLDTDLQTMGTNLDELLTAIDQLDTDLTAVQTALNSIRDDVHSAKAELDRYATVTGEARRVADDARDDLQRDVLWMRVLVIVGALALLTTQALTVIVGRLLVGSDEPPRPLDDSVTPLDGPRPTPTW
jgi:hypothetical protein